MAFILRRRSSTGIGCLMQAIGLASLLLAAVTFVTLWGPILFGLVGVAFVLSGSAKSVWWECSDCGTKLAGKHLKICPGCKSHFEPRPSHGGESPTRGLDPTR